MGDARHVGADDAPGHDAPAPADAPRDGPPAPGGSAGSVATTGRADPARPVDRHDRGPLVRSRKAVRSRPGGVLLLRLVAGVLGLALVALGGALVLLPGPLTIPPVLAGLYVLSLEFAWAERLFERARENGQQAWDSARARPVASALVTAGGLVATGVAFWAVARYDLVARVLDAAGR